MEQVTGIGGLFFRARDPQALGDATKAWMVNFRGRNLGAMTAQLREAGIAVDTDPQTYPNGRFARVYDPEGNPVELWEPDGPDS